MRERERVRERERERTRGRERERAINRFNVRVHSSNILSHTLTPPILISHFSSLISHLSSLFSFFQV
jgi:hypothetical protein